MEEKQRRRDKFDDVFDLLSMLVGSNYVTLYDIKAKVTRYSSAIVDMVDLPGEYISDGMYDWMDYIHPEDAAKYEATMGEMLSLRQRTYDLTYRVRLKNGQYNLFRFVGGIIRDEDGNPGMAGGMMVNAGLMENIDRVTVMPNLRGFFEDMGELSRDGQQVLIVLLVGFGRLAHINERYGYGHGSRLLKAVGKTLREQVKDAGSVYRMEGSKFAVVSSKLSLEEMNHLYDGIRHSFKSGIKIDEVWHNLTSYGGIISLSPETDVKDRTMYDCLLHAYAESKRYRHGALVAYNGNNMDKPEVSGSVELVNAVRESMLADYEGFYLLYQPIYAPESSRPIGAEALLRWKNEKYGDVLPQEFLPDIEQDYAFEKLGYWIIRNALQDGRELLDAEEDFVIYINIAPSQLHDPYFADNVAEIADELDFPLSHLSVELTRECRMLDADTVYFFASSLHEKGVRVGLDDFARGNAWLKTFGDITPDYVRFATDVVQDVDKSERDRIILSYLSRMTADCGTEVFVKGIETREIRDALEGLPIRGIQGLLLSAPVYYDEILDLLEEAD